MLRHIEPDPALFQRLLQYLQSISRRNINTSDSARINDNGLRVFFDMTFDVALQHSDIRKKQIAAKTVDYNRRYCMNLAALPQITKMTVPGLYSKKASRGLRRPDDHLRERQNDADQYTVDCAEHQYSYKRSDEDQKLRS